MGSCFSWLCRDSIPDNHPTKFKVANVNDDGTEVGSGVMELTQTELILHTHNCEAVRWPYLCLRRYGCDSSLFSFESGRRCPTGQGIFAFKCSRAEEIFNLLQDLMQCNHINTLEEPVVVTRNSHPAERELSQPPQASNSLGYTVPGLPNGFHSFPEETPSCSKDWPPSVSSQRLCSLGEDSTRALIGPDEQSHIYVNTARGDQERRGRHCMHSLPEVHPPFPHRNHSCSLEDHEPQVFLQPGEVKFVQGPTSTCKHMAIRDGASQQHRECRTHSCSPNNNEWEDERPSPQCVYENLNGSLPSGRTSRCLKHPREDVAVASRSRHRPALLHYENLSSLPPVWESQAEAALTPSPEDAEDAPLQGGPRRAALPRRHAGLFRLELARPRAEPPRQLNYIQVELQAEAPAAAPAEPGRRTDSYAVIDLKKTAAMSSLQRAVPRDDGIARKTRHNSTDLPL